MLRAVQGDAELAKESRGGAEEEKHRVEAKGEKKQGYGGVEGRGAGVNDRRQTFFFRECKHVCSPAEPFVVTFTSHVTARPPRLRLARGITCKAKLL